MPTAFDKIIWAKPGTIRGAYGQTSDPKPAIEISEIGPIAKFDQAPKAIPTDDVWAGICRQ